ncbi:MAG TPA: hypothetical protein PKD86_17310, partial [Gemmatales bacterium]|nr:hypothetical protein [Gemmatales bacterium]
MLGYGRRSAMVVLALALAVGLWGGAWAAGQDDPVSAEIAARTAGIPIRVPVVDDAGFGRVLPPFALETVEAGEDATSLLVY